MYIPPSDFAHDKSVKELNVPKETGWFSWTVQWIWNKKNVFTSYNKSKELINEKSIDNREIEESKTTIQLQLPNNQLINKYKTQFNLLISHKNELWTEFSDKFFDKLQNNYKEDIEYYKENLFDFYITIITSGTKLYKICIREGFQKDFKLIKKEITKKLIDKIITDLIKDSSEYKSKKQIIEDYQREFKLYTETSDEEKRAEILENLMDKYKLESDGKTPKKKGELSNALATVKKEEDRVFKDFFNVFYNGDKELIEAEDIVYKTRSQLAEVLNINNPELLQKNPALKAQFEQRFSEMYNSDKELKYAVDLIDLKELALKQFLGFNCDDLLNKAKRGTAPRSKIQKAKDFVKENPSLSFSMASIIGTLLYAPEYALYTVGVTMAPAVIHKAYKVLGPKLEQKIIEENILWDNIAYLRDKEVRDEIWSRIFLKGPSESVKEEALKQICASRLLFKEDLLNDPELKQFVEDHDIQDLPELAEYEKHRKDYIKLLHEPFVTNTVKQECLKELFERNLLFKEDFAIFNESERNELLDGLDFNYDDLPEAESLKKTRSRLFQILKKGLDLTEDEKLAKLIELHQLGLFFQKDFEKLIQFPTLEQKFLIYLRTNNITTESFPIYEGYYEKTNITLQREQDAIREPFLNKLKDNNSTPEEKLFALKEMHIKRICFNEDLELVPEAIKQKFIKFIKMSPEERGKEFRTQKDAAIIIKHHEDVLSNKNSSKQEKLQSLFILYLEGIKTANELKKLADTSVILEFNRNYLSDINIMLDELPNRKGFYERGYYEMLHKIMAMVQKTVENNPGKIVGLGVGIVSGPIVGVLAGAGAMAVGGRYRQESPSELLSGTVQDAKMIVGSLSEMKSQAIKDFTEIGGKNLYERIVRQMPSDNQVNRALQGAINKGIGTMKWTAFGAAAGATVASLFSLSMVTTGTQVGAAVGGAYGLAMTDRTVNQLPPGGFIRSIKWGTAGALAGASVPVVLGVLTIGLSIAGLISAGVALSVVSLGFSFIVPLIIFGVYAGFQLAGLTAKEEVEDYIDPVISQLGSYEPMEFEWV